jgi:NADP-dependent 3-hydroxy acid dehydrogenase YdfG
MAGAARDGQDTGIARQPLASGAIAPRVARMTEIDSVDAPVVLVTGAARRVGAVIARTLHGAGYRVALHHRA